MTNHSSPVTAELDSVYDALVQAQDCIRGETPEDITDAEAREDTINKVREAMRQVEAMRRPAQQPASPVKETDLLARSGNDFAPIPHDGSDQIFEVTMRLHAFWCPDLRDWILCRPMKGERLPSGARHIGPGAVVGGTQGD